MQLVRPHLVHGGNHAAQNVVEAVVGARALYGLDVARLGHHADGRAVARAVRAHVAGVPRGVREANGAEVHLLLNVQDCRGQAAGLLRVGLQQVICDALGGLGAHARQSAKLVQQALQGPPVVRCDHAAP